MLFFRNLVALSATSVEVHWHDCRERRLKERLKDRTLRRLEGRMNHRLEGPNFASAVGTVEPPVGRPDFASVGGLLKDWLKDQTLLRL